MPYAALVAILLLAGCEFDGPNPFPPPSLKETHLGNLPQPQPRQRQTCDYVKCKNKR